MMSLKSDQLELSFSILFILELCFKYLDDTENKRKVGCTYISRSLK